MKIATWNVNSVRTRLERLLLWLDRHQPDVLCLQELKCQEQDFPFEAIEQAGYYAEVNGQKAYNGVAILSREFSNDVRLGMGDESDDTQARVISAEFSGVRVFSIYIPNGCDMETDKYPYKLDWLSRFREMLTRDYTPDQPIVICGDTNVIIHDDDAHSMKFWKNTGIGGEEVRENFAKVTDWGLTDVFRQHHPEGGIYSWWSYRQMGFQKNQGIRIDHVLTTAPMTERCKSITIDRNERKGDKPSDHAPVIAEFDN